MRPSTIATPEAFDDAFALDMAMGGSLGVAASAVDGCLVEEGGELEVLLLAEGVVFVIVTAAAIEREREPDRSGGLGHVHDVVDAVLFGNAAPFAIDGMVAQEGSGELLLHRRLGKEVAGELPDGEVVPGNVPVEGVDHPVPPWPLGSFPVALVAIRVQVA